MDKLNEKERQGALREAVLLKGLRHPNIVAYVDSFIENGTLIIIMEYCECILLFYRLKINNKQKEIFHFILNVEKDFQ